MGNFTFSRKKEEQFDTLNRNMTGLFMCFFMKEVRR